MKGKMENFGVLCECGRRLVYMVDLERTRQCVKKQRRGDAAL